MTARPPADADAALLAAKREPGAYITREGKLYEVVRWDEKDRWLVVINSSTYAELRLTGAQTAAARLVQAAPTLNLP